MEEAIKKVDILIEALPYIKKFHNKVVVIKYGGSAVELPDVRKGILEDIAFMKFVGMRPVLVHGGGPAISQKMRDAGIKIEFIDGFRVTTAEVMGIVAQTLLEINEQIVNEIKETGAKAIGFSGSKGAVLKAKKKQMEKDLGFAGDVDSINTATVKKAFARNEIPVISPVGVGADKNLYNVNGDDVASSVAIALKAEKLVILTNVKGILRNKEDENSVLSTIKEEEVKELIERGVISEGMMPKVKAAIKVLDGKVKKVHIINAKLQHSLLLEIFTDKGIGTEIVK